MFSEHKSLIRTAEWLAIADSAGGIGLAMAASLGRVSPERVAPLLLPIGLVSMAVFAVSVGLFHEFARVLHGPPGLRQEVELSLAEMKWFVRWCPGVLELAFVAAAIVLVCTLLFLGAVDWSFGQPVTRHEATGIPLFASVFSLVSIPVLASASRMPGSFADHFSSAARGKG